jgi:mono/diheme cytochrome c family protein
VDAATKRGAAWRRRLKRGAAWSAGALLLAAGAGAAAVETRWDRRFQAPYPQVHASADSALIERGAYLVYGPAHCAYCHTQPQQWAALDRGERVPLSGGYPFVLPMGTFRSPNLTPDPETGIGRLDDAAIARVLRHGVMPDGRATLPFMAFHGMSDDDLTAVLSYLRSQPAVRNAVPDRDPNFLGRALLAFVLEPHAAHASPPQVAPPQAPTVERGRYLAENVANCAGCHTKRSMLDGRVLGGHLAGGAPMPAESIPGKVLVPPNLTPDPATGRIATWTEDQFVARIRAGGTVPGSHMPWRAFARMSDTDLRALYRYLRSIPPIVNDPGPSVQDAKA